VKNKSRPFTLEGNFAFAAAVQEMLLQSYDGVLRVFPAVPTDWKDVSFENLRAEGAVLVSARMEQGRVVRISMTADKTGQRSSKSGALKRSRWRRMWCGKERWWK